MAIWMSKGVSGVRSSKFRNWSNNFSSDRSAMYDGIETINWVSGIFDNALGAVGFDQRVGTGYNVSRAGFLLALVISGNSILVWDKIYLHLHCDVFDSKS